MNTKKTKHSKHILNQQSPTNNKRLATSDQRLNSEAVIMVFLAVLGLVYSLSFLGHFVFPNSDFVSFLGTGRQWISFHIPQDMKRAPVFAIVTALIGKVFSQRPDGALFGSEFYNALMLPAGLVLIYLAGRRSLGQAAVWVAVLSGISPWMVRMASEPLAEVTIVVFFAATAVCVASNSRWAYLFAMLCSVTRWDMAAIVPAVTIIDFVRNRRSLRAVLLSVLSLIPFGACMVITKMRLAGQTGGAHYLQVLLKDRTFELAADLNLYWQTVCSFINIQLLQTVEFGGVRDLAVLNTAVFWITAAVLLTAFAAGSIAAFINKRWELIFMLLVIAPYILVHAVYPYRLERYCVPAAWAILTVAVYGAIVLRQRFAAGPKPKFLVPALQIAGAVIFIIWSIKASDTLHFAQKKCPALERLVAASAIVSVAGFFAVNLVRRCRPSAGWLVMPAFLVLAVVSSGATSGFLMGNGQDGANFKKLAQWFLKNAGPDDMMLTTMAGFMPIYSGLPAERFVHISSIKPEDANDFTSFVQKCRQRKITIIAWDSRLAGRRNDLYYKLWGIDRVEVLGGPFLGKKTDAIGGCRLVQTISDGTPKIAVWRIVSESG